MDLAAESYFEESTVRSSVAPPLMAHDTSVLPVIDLKPFLDDPHSAAAKEVCTRIAEVLRQTSCLVIRDPRVCVMPGAHLLFETNYWQA